MILDWNVKILWAGNYPWILWRENTSETCQKCDNERDTKITLKELMRCLILTLWHAHKCHLVGTWLASAAEWVQCETRRSGLLQAFWMVRGRNGVVSWISIRFRVNSIRRRRYQQCFCWGGADYYNCSYLYYDYALFHVLTEHILRTWPDKEGLIIARAGDQIAVLQCSSTYFVELTTVESVHQDVKQVSNLPLVESLYNVRAIVECATVVRVYVNHGLISGLHVPVLLLAREWSTFYC